MSRKLIRVSVVVFVLIMLPQLGCISGTLTSKQINPAHDTAVFNKKAKGLNLELIDFTWFYQEDLDQIQVTGSVRNLTGRHLQACRIIVTAHDQHARFLGRKESFLQPTYLSPNKVAKFELYLEDGREVKSLHLQYYFKTRY
ncbi:MAG: hypothetical protein JRI34_13895 [Deltaproteobacteria bacterium]|nr:hypothetical protein [Deltaproteobacteria bacterium]